ncbi:MAG: 4Fe-4S dicluster domain-containing protein, partial [Bacteroidaceae bacterium]|nr:4Fe-4S dicluster domain-containing protein [Bacteroidaceae bacterium]
GMTYMEHLQDNLRTYCPLTPCSQEETDMLHNIGDAYVDKAYIPCTSCQYCMPCPYGINIPAIFTHYNKTVNEGNYNVKVTDANYREARRAFLVGYDRTVPKLRQASHCIGCDQCVVHCPQGIKIPDELHRIDRYVEDLKRKEA